MRWEQEHAQQAPVRAHHDGHPDTPKTRGPTGSSAHKQHLSSFLTALVDATPRTAAPAVPEASDAGPQFKPLARHAQPLEPILFPKLRICFVDFPYLHCST